MLQDEDRQDPMCPNKVCGEKLSDKKTGVKKHKQGVPENGFGDEPPSGIWRVLLIE